MSDFDRRSVLKVGLGGAALLAGPGIVPVRAAEWTNTPEPNASIRVLRWKQFIQAEFDKFAEQTKAFSEKTGVKIKLEAESWEDIRPKAAVAANVGAGPDLIIGTLDDPHKFPEKLIDMTDVAGLSRRAVWRLVPGCRTLRQEGQQLDRHSAGRDRRLPELSR
ncbi:ABC-type glycerol-3-phosphate transport system substrate-binding protein [Bradyrhizobium sp. GM5.1]